MTDASDAAPAPGATAAPAAADPAGAAAAEPADAAAAEPADPPTLDLVGPLAGFPEHRRYALVALDEAGLLFALRSLDEPGLRFFVVPPAPFFPDYAPEVEDAWVERLALESAADATVLLVVTPGATAAEATANLLAPVVVNRRTRVGAQVVLHADLPVRAPLAGTG